MKPLLKYKAGQKLKLMTTTAVDSVWAGLEDDNEDVSDITLSVGDIIEVFPSDNFPPEAYGIRYKGYISDQGWQKIYIEDTDFFEPIKGKITNWKKEMEPE